MGITIGLIISKILDIRKAEKEKTNSDSIRKDF